MPLADVKHDESTNGQSNGPNTYEISNFTSVLAIAVIFVLSVICLAIVFMNFPEMDEDDTSKLYLPRDIDGAKDLGRVLSKYKDSHYYTVLSGVIVTYIFLQTFAIPGSIFLSILSGFLFPFFVALLLVCMCSAVGATFCYFLSSLVGHGLVKRWLPNHLQSWKLKVIQHRSDILNYITFLRITPFVPNWFINIASPILGVPVLPFFIGTFIGVAPPSFLFIRAGTTLYELTTATGHISMTSVLILTVLAIISLLPVAFRKWIKNKLD